MYMYPIRETIYISSQAALSRPFWHQSFSHQIFVLPEVRESFFSKMMLTWYRTCFAYRYTSTVSTCIVIIFMMKWEQLWWFSERIIVFFWWWFWAVENAEHDKRRTTSLAIKSDTFQVLHFPERCNNLVRHFASCNLGTWRGSAVTPDRTAIAVTRPRSICQSPQEAGGPAAVWWWKGEDLDWLVGWLERGISTSWNQTIRAASFLVFVVDVRRVKVMSDKAVWVACDLLYFSKSQPETVSCRR